MKNAEKLRTKTDIRLKILSGEYYTLSYNIEKCYVIMIERAMRAKVIELIFIRSGGKRRNQLQRDIKQIEEYLPERTNMRLFGGL